MDAATRRLAKALSEISFAPRGRKGDARKAAARALRRTAAAEIAEALSAE